MSNDWDSVNVLPAGERLVLLATMMRMASFCGRGTLVVTPELAALGETFSPAPFLHYPSPLPPLLPPRVPDPFLRFLLLLPLLLLRLYHSCSAHSAAAVRISSTITTAAFPVYLPSSFSSFSFPPSPFIFNTVSFILPLPSFSFHHFRHSFLFGVLLLFVFFLSLFPSLFTSSFSPPSLPPPLPLLLFLFSL